ncbi:peptide chain release factor RF-3 [Escherichia coli]|nr:peptide chain release factor RF-3 [Escherichia coli]
MAGDRSHVEEAYPGDNLGLHNHGTIQIGDTFTQGEEMKLNGIAKLAQELYGGNRLKGPQHQKQIPQGMVQVPEEGAERGVRVSA